MSNVPTFGAWLKRRRKALDLTQDALARLVGCLKEQPMLTYRTATLADVAELAQMGWDFRLEEAPGPPTNDAPTFLSACAAFLRQGLVGKQWTYWIATTDVQIVSHIFIQTIAKVPKPNRLDEALGYVTNVYTRPAYRNQGIGTELMRHALQWAQQADLESLIVWPSEASVSFYGGPGSSPAPR